MELIGFTGTHVTRLFNVMRPSGASPLPRLIKAVQERYAFQIVPQDQELLADKFFFRMGVFEENAIDSFEVYTDGVVARGRCNSDVLDAFLDDAEHWFNSALEARRIETHSISRNYESGVVIQATDALLSALSPLDRVCSAISSSLQKANGANIAFHPFGFVLSPEDTKISGLRPVQFRLERKLGTDFDKGLFMSNAPLRTDDHLKLLGYIEKSLAR